jgi:hypothetical protein
VIWLYFIAKYALAIWRQPIAKQTLAILIFLLNTLWQFGDNLSLNICLHFSATSYSITA